MANNGDIYIGLTENERVAIRVVQKLVDDATLILTRQINNLLNFQIAAEAHRLGLATDEEFKDILQEQVKNCEVIDEAVEDWIEQHEEKEEEDDADNE